MKELIEFIVSKITDSSKFTVDEIPESDEKITFEISADPEIIGLIIGKKGATIKAIQDLVKVRARLEKKFVYINVTEKK